MPFLTEPEPERGANLPVLPGISRIVANNPSPMTYFGTNTYLIETPEGLVVLDPGPEGHPEHVEAILRHTGGQEISILSPKHAAQHDIAYVPRERRLDSLFAWMSIRENFALPTLGRDSSLGMIRTRSSRRRLGSIR